MNVWFTKIYRNRHFLLFIMLFAYVQSIYIRISAREEINAYIFTPDALLYHLFKAGLLFAITWTLFKRWKKADAFSLKEGIQLLGLSLILYLIVMKVSGFLVSLLFQTTGRNFNQQTFLFTLFADFLDGIIYGSFFIAYYYFNRSKKKQQQLIAYHQALTDTKIHQLKSQLNPHFLFNNLNILDQLIEEDKHKASLFLNEFAEIYRYVLQSSESNIIGLREETDFAIRYFKLIQHKYGAAYQLNITGKSNHGFIVPLTFQLLIENAVQHNLGTEEEPVVITIHITNNISVLNNINHKRNVKATQGRALSNLKQQYTLLAKKPIEFQQSDNIFSVTIPIIYL